MKQAAYCIFNTPLGPCGIAWVEPEDPCCTPVVTFLQLPEATTKMTESKIVQNSGARRSNLPLPSIAGIIRKVCRHLSGELQDFRNVDVDLSGDSPFARQVYEAVRKIPAGKTTTYGELAKSLKRPAAARAVGQALGSNPIILIIPCHRVLAAGGKLGGFSAHGGVETKAKLLSIEGASFMPHATAKYGWRCVIDA